MTKSCQFRRSGANYPTIVIPCSRKASFATGCAFISPRDHSLREGRERAEVYRNSSRIKPKAITIDGDGADRSAEGRWRVFYIGYRDNTQMPGTRYATWMQTAPAYYGSQLLYLLIKATIYTAVLECLRKYVFRNVLQKLSRRQYMRYIFEKKAKMCFIEGRFWSKVAVYFVSVLLAYNAPSICPRQKASATAYSAPNRTGQTGQAPLFVQQQHKQWTHGGLRR